MTSVMLRRVTDNYSVERVANDLIDLHLGNRGGMIRLRGFDGNVVSTSGGTAGTALSSNRYPLDVQSPIGFHAAFVLSGTSPTATPTTANSAVLITDAGLSLASGTGLRIYETAGTDYSELTSLDGLLSVGGSGANAGMMALGTTPATTGQIRIPNNRGVSTRNAGNTQNFNLIGSNGSDQVLVGDTANTALTAVQSSTDVRLTIAGSTILTALSTGVGITPGLLQIGTTPATTGTVRVPNNTTALAARNAANTANITVIISDSSNNLFYGDQSNAPSVYLQGTTDVRIRAGGSELFKLDNSSISFGGSGAATTGTLRLVGGGTMYWRNAANSANIHVLGVNGSDQINLGQTGTQANLLGTVVAPSIDPPTVDGQVTTGSQCKAYAYVTGGGGATLGQNYNITSVTRNAAGDFTVTIDRDFSGTTYAVVATVQDNGANLLCRVNGQAAGSFDIHFRDTAGVLTDPDAFAIACFGTLS